MSPCTCLNNAFIETILVATIPSLFAVGLIFLKSRLDNRVTKKKRKASLKYEFIETIDLLTSFQDRYIVNANFMAMNVATAESHLRRFNDTSLQQADRNEAKVQFDLYSGEATKLQTLGQTYILRLDELKSKCSSLLVEIGDLFSGEVMLKLDEETRKLFDTLADESNFLVYNFDQIRFSDVAFKNINRNAFESDVRKRMKAHAEFVDTIVRSIRDVIQDA